MPVKQVVNGATVLGARCREWVRDGSQVQQNIVRVGRRPRGAAHHPQERQRVDVDGRQQGEGACWAASGRGAPQGTKIDAAVRPVGVRLRRHRRRGAEGAIAAGLTGLMILLFLGSWRSTLIVLVSIPLSILTSLAVMLAALGETLNVMTLGGLALAVGILVDDATVAIENTYRLLDERQDFRERGRGGRGRDCQARADLDAGDLRRLHLGAVPDRRGQVHLHAAGAGGRVRDAGLLRAVAHAGADPDRRAGQEREARRQITHDPEAPAKPGWFGRLHARFERGFERFQGQATTALLDARGSGASAGSRTSVVARVLADWRRAVLVRWPRLFPADRRGQMQLHVRARSGLRIEEAERFFQRVEDTIREIVPDRDRGADPRQHRPAREQL